MTICEIFETIQNTPKTLDKKSILKENMNDTIQKIFEDTYGSKKYYVKKFNRLDVSGNLTLDNDYDHFRSTLNELSSRHVTGTAAYMFLQSTVADFDENSQDILCRIIDRNLKIGISKDNFNDVVGNTIEKFEVALAYNLEKVKGVNPIDGTYYASRKCDGARCITIIDTIENTIIFKSRQGKEFKTLDNLKTPILNAFKLSNLVPNKYVVDGEICIIDDDGNEHFNWIMKEITRKDHTIQNPHYKLFDILTYDEFIGETTSDIFSNRYNLLKNIFEDCEWYSVLDQECITCQEDFNKWTQKVSDGGWEGFMLRKNAPYESGRTKDLLKIKKFQDEEYVVKGIINGKATYNENGAKEYDVVSALIIEHKGNEVFVGSGLSKEQRINWFGNPNEIIGKTITVQYFEETKDSKTNMYSLRFPVLKYVYENGREL